MIKLFAHRGYKEDFGDENSLTSLESAHKKNFRAIEFDIWFLENQLILKHDEPKKNEISKLPNFDQYLIYGNQMEYWCDFKNLNETNALNALRLVKQIAIENFIELNQLYLVPFITDYKTATNIIKIIRQVFGSKARIGTICDNLETRDDKVKLKQFLQKNKIKYLSIFHQLIDEELVSFLPSTKFMAWTVNEISRLTELQKLGIEIFATDKITPK